MENATIPGNQTVLVTYEGQRVAAIVIGSFAMIWSVYVSSMLCVFEVYVYKKNASIGTIQRSRRRSQQVTKDSAADWMRRLCLAASLLLIIRITTEFVEIRYGEISHDVCLHIRKFKSVVHSLVVTCIYLVLWVRQRGFYKMAALAQLSNPFVRSMSFFVVIIMAVTNICTIGLYLSTRAYMSSLRGCVVEWSSIWTLIPGLVLFISTLLFQIILLGLLVNPILQHLKAIRQTGMASTKTGPSKEMVLIKRVTIAAVMAIATDIICGGISVFLLKKKYGVLRHLVYDFDMLISLTCVIVSFNDWRDRLFPFLVTPDKVVGTIRRLEGASDHTSENTNIATIS
uniref:uncharacterized protein LOC113474457 n=1 Tax=Ciona intestinalis TaxID=7719 RepID=UPI000EF461C2|nr:uncharacterized protein LOC113474457 [Ciona intestinalis]|eukprot:XP_026691411.1 uncharacterized protein LOC113474457 [Ciona intestinalis]